MEDFVCELEGGNEGEAEGLISRDSAIDPPSWTLVFSAADRLPLVVDGMAMILVKDRLNG